jgi:hypothetical protein
VHLPLTRDQLEIVAAALLDMTDEAEELAADLSTLVHRLNATWTAHFDHADVNRACTLLEDVAAVSRADNQQVRIIGYGISTLRDNRYAPTIDLHARYPLLSTYAQFGRDWLQAAWPHFFPRRPAPDASRHDTAPGATAADAPRYDSSAWTGITSTQVTAANSRRVVILVDEALAILDNEHSLSNFQKGQAVGLLKAARQLAELPDPPSPLFWEVVGRAADVSGLFSVFRDLFVRLVTG